MGMAASTTFGRRLKELRVRQGLTQQALAHPHYTHAYVSSLEAGRRHPSQDALDHFAGKLDVDPDELLTGRPAGLTPSLELQLHEARIAASAGQLAEADGAFIRIAAEAERFDLVHVRARAEYGRGVVCEHNGRINEALAHYEKTQELLKEHPDVARTDAIVGQARCAQDLGDVRYAIYLLESHLDSLARTGLEDPTSKMIVYATMVLPYMKLGILRKAGECAERALELIPRVIDPAKLASMHVNVARVLLAQRNYVDATASLRRAEDLFRQLDLQVELGIAHLAVGYVLKRDGKSDAAKAELRRAIAIFTTTRSKVNEANATNELAGILREEGEIAEARSLLMQSIDLLKNEDDVSELAQAHRELALCALDADPGQVEKDLHRAIELFERAEEPMQIAATYRVLGDFLRNSGRTEEGCEAYRTGIVELECHI
jgi:tetratricopeptide (TPR) repeat protein